MSWLAITITNTCDNQLINRKGFFWLEFQRFLSMIGRPHCFWPMALHHSGSMWPSKTALLVARKQKETSWGGSLNITFMSHSQLPKDFPLGPFPQVPPLPVVLTIGIRLLTHAFGEHAGSELQQDLHPRRKAHLASSGAGDLM